MKQKLKISDAAKAMVVQNSIKKVSEDQGTRLYAMGMLQKAGMSSSDYQEIKQTLMFDLMMAVSILPWVGSGEMALEAFEEFRAGNIDEENAIALLACNILAHRSGILCLGSTINWDAISQPTG